ncbi:MAG: hypothetical protein INQ03_02690 [Candidatus Heimdallarchaeota archaeon]|nr:hypothetical protein [Candidatus Heimdallarchaeota archaeon]
MVSTEETPSKELEILYTYWENIPFKKKFTTNNFLQTTQSHIKSFIIKYIRDGIEDEYSINNRLPRRHAFTVKEIYEAYQKQEKKQKYSLSNFHFHIKKLIEDGYIQEITKILHGRHYVIYYGRTAIIFNSQFDQDFSLMTSKTFYDPLKDLIKEMHPKMEIGKINSIVDDNQNLLADYYQKIEIWMQKKYPHLYSSQVDLMDFMTFAAHFALTDRKFADSLEQIATLIDFNLEGGK